MTGYKNKKKKTFSVNCENVLENGTGAVIGLFHERNVVRMRAAIQTFGGALRDSQKTAAKGD